MAKLVFPGASAPYRGYISEVRTWLQMIASFARQSPASNAVINEQLAVLAAATGFVTDLPDDAGIVSNDDLFSVPDGEDTVAIKAVVTGNTVTFVMA